MITSLTVRCVRQDRMEPLSRNLATSSEGAGESNHNLVESELFGIEKASPTGVDRAHREV